MEQWRDIPGFEHLYQASDMGRIRTCEGKITKSARSQKRVWRQRIMKIKWRSRYGGQRKDGRVCLWKDGKAVTCLVARLVARAWCDGYAEGLTVNHIDGNSENNAACNLEWVTLGDNIRDAFKNGQHTNTKRVQLVDGSGKVMEFRSMAEASRYLGKGNGYISNMVNNGYRVPGHQVRVLG